jgi:hypothetical protein
MSNHIRSNAKCQAVDEADMEACELFEPYPYGTLDVAFEKLNSGCWFYEKGKCLRIVDPALE